MGIKSYSIDTEFPTWLNEKYRFKRYMTVEDLPYSKLGFCFWCGKKIEGPYSKFCSEMCSYQYSIRSSSKEMTKYIKDRDHGICSICGIDAEEIYNLMLYVYKTPEFFSKMGKRKWGVWHSSSPQSRFWEIDHILPVSEGGGCCGLKNLRTLCIKCHKKETDHLLIRRNNKIPERQMRFEFV